MVLLVIQFTVFALTCVAAWIAAARANAAAHSEARLLSMRGRIVGLEGALEALDTKHRKLAGRVYQAEPRDEQPAREVPHLGAAPPDASMACEKYLQAQREGPTSPAASCTCAYCEGMRAHRAGLRATLLKPVKAKRGE